MKRRREEQNGGMDLTTFALLVAIFGGLGIVTYGESLLGDIQNAGDPHGPNLANWQVHMGAACMGSAAFVTILFLLELLNRQSKINAWRSSWPWLPLVVFTGFAAVIHIPACAVTVICTVDSVWAYVKLRRGAG
jgi:hypothetical protein